MPLGHLLALHNLIDVKNLNNVEELLLMPTNAPCELRKSVLEKDSLTWEMSCNQGGFATVAKGRILFMGTRLQGEIKIVAKGPQPSRSRPVSKDDIWDPV